MKFLNDVGSAVVLRMEGGLVVVEDEDGFERSVERRETIVALEPEVEADKYGNTIPDIATLLAQDVGEKRMRELQKEFEVDAKLQATSMARRDAHMEVDLIHELVDDQRGLPDRAKLAIQMDHFDRMMDIAKRPKASQNCVHHGVGQGVLRHQIRTSLDQHHPDCTYRRRSKEIREWGHRCGSGGVVAETLIARMETSQFLLRLCVGSRYSGTVATVVLDRNVPDKVPTSFAPFQPS